jgi:hypothetical protein
MLAVPVIPAAPATTPVGPTEAINVLLLLHVPPVVVSIKGMFCVPHTAVGPVIAAG